MDGVRAWQQRSLEDLYPVVFLEASFPERRLAMCPETRVDESAPGVQSHFGDRLPD
jgi:hypothetical protein